MKKIVFKVSDSDYQRLQRRKTKDVGEDEGWDRWAKQLAKETDLNERLTKKIAKNTRDTLAKLWMKNLGENLSIIRKSKISLRDVAADKPNPVPAIIVGAGPSLYIHNHIDKLKKFRGVIFATDRMLIPLLKAGVHVDYVVSIDGNGELIPKFFGDPIVEDSGVKVCLVLQTHPNTLAVCQKRGLQPYWFHSVTPDMPIIIKKKGFLDVIPIADLKRRRSNRNPTKRKVYNTDAWTSNGWSKIPWVGYHKYKGKIIRTIMSNGMVDVTPNHSLLDDCKQVIPANCVKIGDKMLTQTPPNPLAICHVPTDLAWLYGLFAADGSANTYFNVGRKKETLFHWGITNTNKKIIEKVLEIVPKYLGVGTRVDCIEANEANNQKKLYTVKVNEKIKLISSWFNSEFYTKDRHKKIPRIILNADLNTQRAFLSGFIAGDGRVEINGKSKKEILYTSSKTLATGLYLLAKWTGNDYITMFDYAEKNAVRLFLNHPRIKRIRHPPSTIYKIGTYDYEGWVYDIETASHDFVAGIGEQVVHNTMQDDPKAENSSTRSIMYMTMSESNPLGVPSVPSGGNAGTTALCIAIDVLKHAYIGLVGFDFGYPKGTPMQKTYYYSSVFASYKKQLPDSKIASTHALVHFNEFYHPVFKSYAISDPVFDGYRESLYEILSNMTRPCKIYNLSQGGTLYNPQLFECISLDKFLNTIAKEYV